MNKKYAKHDKHVGHRKKPRCFFAPSPALSRRALLRSPFWTCPVTFAAKLRLEFLAKKNGKSMLNVNEIHMSNSIVDVRNISREQKIWLYAKSRDLAAKV